MSSLHLEPSSIEDGSCYGRRACSIYLSEPFPNQSLASTLVDYRGDLSNTSSTTRLLGPTVADEHSLYEQPRAPHSAPRVWTATNQKLILRLTVFAIAIATHGLVLSFGPLLAQDSGLRSSTPKWTIALISSLQLCLLHASIPLAFITARSRWSKCIHVSAGIIAALLTVLRPQYHNITEGIVLRGVLQGLALGLFNNITLCMALSIRYDHVTGVLASLGAPIGGAVIPLALAAASGTTAVERGFGLWLLCLTAGSAYALQKPTTNVPPAALKLKVFPKYLHTTPLRWPQLCCIAALCLAQLALYVPPTLLFVCLQEGYGLDGVRTAAVLTTFWLSNASAKLITARGKSRRHSARKWIVLYSLAYSATSVAWCFVVSIKGTFVLAVTFGGFSGCWLGTYTSAMVELLGPETAAASQGLLNVLAATAVLCGLPIGAGLMDVGGASQLGPAAFTALCFGLAGLLLWLPARVQGRVY